MALGYKWQKESKGKVPRTKLIWARPNIRRHAFIYWVLIQHRLATKQRLSKYLPKAHLFYTHNYAKIIWNEIRNWWQYTPAVHNSNPTYEGTGEKQRTRDTEVNY